MEHHEYERIAQHILPRVARCVPVNAAELSLVQPGNHGDESWASVYWMAMYVCKARIQKGTLTLSDWRPLWADRGRLEFPIEPTRAPEDWTPLDPCPECGCQEIGIGHGSYGATYATCQRCGWQDVLVEGDPDYYEEDAHQQALRAHLEGEAMAAADWWGEDLYGPRGTYR